MKEPFALASFHTCRLANGARPQQSSSGRRVDQEPSRVAGFPLARSASDLTVGASDGLVGTRAGVIAAAPLCAEFPLRRWNPAAGDG